MTTSLTTEQLLAQLTELALDLRWTWDHATDKIWRKLDPVLWELTQNPLVVLQTTSKERIEEALADPLIRAVVLELSEAKQQHACAPAWFQHQHANSALTGVAFFSMEFMLSEALPIYSGGLGNVAGDLLKTASDLGVPMYGIGLLYQQGYSRQVIYDDGSQQYVAPFNEPGQLPVTPLRNAKGEWLRIEIKLSGYSVWLRTWQVQVGRVHLFLLDSNDAANFPVYRCVTNELYGGDATMRLLQEVVLGIGGWLLLEELELQPEVVHLNEGHAAFVVLERAVKLMDKTGISFDEALAITRSGNIFTTHTAVGAGFDLFPPDLLQSYLGNYVRNRLKISFSNFLALGRKNPADASEPFNTAYLAIRGSGQVNGVSRLHAAVSRQLFSNPFSRWPLDEVPISHVTNGVHMPTWDSAEADNFWTESCGKDRWLGTLEILSQQIGAVADTRLWQMRVAQKQTFVAYMRFRYAQQVAMAGRPLQDIEAAWKIFDPAVLTIGFARRFAGYKRPNLLLKNPARLKKLLQNEERPVQLVVAGKAHPKDKPGQLLIQQWVQFIRNEKLQHRLVFLSDYDMHLSEHLVQGVDLWINTPLRPWEACGTSGMKVLVNGGLNLSELDGWWDEAYNSELGWAIGDQHNHAHDPGWDTAEAEQLFNLLEEQVLLAYYSFNEQGIPGAWVSKMRQSMAQLTPQFSANRSLRQYVDAYYLPAAKAYLERSCGNGKAGKLLVAKKKAFEQHWQSLRFGDSRVTTEDGRHTFTTQVHLGQLCVDDLRVELYAEAYQSGFAERHAMQREMLLKAEPSSPIFTISLPAARKAEDYTVRILPKSETLSVPLELPFILWQR